MDQQTQSMFRKWMAEIQFDVFKKSELIKWCDAIIVKEDNPDIDVIDLALTEKLSHEDIFKLLYSYSGTVPHIKDYYSVLLNVLTEKSNISDYGAIRDIRFSFLMNYRDLIDSEIESLIYTVDHYIDDCCLRNGIVTEVQVKETIFELLVALRYQVSQ